MIRFRRECCGMILFLIILTFLLTLKIQENTRLPEPLAIISSANQLTELTTLQLDNTTTISNFYSSNASLVQFGMTYTTQITEEIPSEPVPSEKIDSNQYIFYQAIWNCQCSRRFMYPPSSQNHTHKFSRLNSSCSDEGTHYQPNQNVISMSMFLSSNLSQRNHNPLSYQISLAQNLIKMRQMYPSYSLRIYTNISLVANSHWCKVLCKNTDLFWCDIRRTPSHGNLNGMNFRTWRFLVLGDPTVQVFQSRDLDSLISHREGAAVQDWLESAGDKAFMLMRDKRRYHNSSILAGMWGAQNNRLEEKGNGALLREQIIKLSQQKENQETKPFDQRMLGALIVDERGRDVVAYDSYHCKQWAKKTMVRPYPTQRLEDIPERAFVGNRIDFKGDGKGQIHTYNQEYLICPVECRPSYGKDWKYC